MKAFKAVVSAFFPNKCAACGEIIDEDEYFCDYCYQMLEFTDFSNTCINCGLTKSDCACKHRVFHFNGCVSPFAKNGIAETAMYRFKFSKIMRNGEYFSKQMALTVKNQFYDIKFDGVTFVPMHFLKHISRGFNQSEKIAKEIANILELPLFENLLYCKKKNRVQHRLNFKERFENIRGKYGTKYKITGKTLLLVDDIKTTGATLDECAKQLLLAGADKVYCITGLITLPKKGKNKWQQI